MEWGTHGLLVKGILLALVIYCATPVLADTTTIPPILTAADAEIAKEAFNAASHSQWGLARDVAHSLTNPLPKDVIEWLFLTESSGNNNFDSLLAFTKAHPDWPGHTLLQAKLEDALPRDLPAIEVTTWFQNDPPSSNAGRLRLGAALVSLGELERGQQILRESWILSDFTRWEERTFYKQYKKILEKDDHAKRLERLLWNGKTDATRRMLSRTSPAAKKLGIARIYLIENHPDVDKAIAALPKTSLSNPGLIYERVRWRRRAGKDERARQLLFSLPDHLVHPDKWWQEIKYQIRICLNNGLISDAYLLAANNSLFGKTSRAEADWLAGWIALRFLNEIQAAYQHFTAMQDIVSMPISLARSAYWAAQASDADGHNQLADEWFKRSVAHPTTFYGQLSGIALGHKRLTLPSEPRYDWEDVLAFEKRKIVRITRMLGEIGEVKLMRRFAIHLAQNATTPREHALISRLTTEYDFPQVSIAAAKRSVRFGVILVGAGYPNPFPSDLWEKDTPEPALVLAVSRQESEMDQRAISNAGARGLLQLMPFTAKQMAQKLKIRYVREQLLDDPLYNIRLGAAYLTELLNRYKGSYVLALAAYNAGPKRVKKWLHHYGDPRTKDVSLVDWIELLPYHETRNYIQRVLETMEVYRNLLERTDAVPAIGTW